MQETRVQFLDQKDPLEKEMATHSSILPGKFPQQRSLAGYRPQMGSHRVRNDCATKHTHTFLHRLSCFQIKNYNNSLSLCTLYVLFTYKNVTLFYADFQVVLVVKSPPANAENIGSIPGSERSPGEGNGNPLQYSCSGNPMDTGAWWGYSLWDHVFSD